MTYKNLHVSMTPDRAFPPVFYGRMLVANDPNSHNPEAT